MYSFRCAIASLLHSSRHVARVRRLQGVRCVLAHDLHRAHVSTGVCEASCHVLEVADCSGRFKMLLYAGPLYVVSLTILRNLARGLVQHNLAQDRHDEPQHKQPGAPKRDEGTPFYFRGRVAKNHQILKDGRRVIRQKWNGQHAHNFSFPEYDDEAKENGAQCDCPPDDGFRWACDGGERARGCCVCNGCDEFDDACVRVRVSVCVSVCVCVCVAVWCCVLPRVAVCCSVLQCVAVCCSVLQCDAFENAWDANLRYSRPKRRHSVY